MFFVLTQRFDPTQEAVEGRSCNLEIARRQRCRSRQHAAARLFNRALQRVKPPCYAVFTGVLSRLISRRPGPESAIQNDIASGPQNPAGVFPD